MHTVDTQAHKTEPEHGSPAIEEVSSDPAALAATGRRLRTVALVIGALLLIGFLVVQHLKSKKEEDLAAAATKGAAASRAIDVVPAENSPASSPLTLPGETAAWNESVIYARVDGYVATWMSDIGDHVKKGQVLATIDTPELDAQMLAAQAKYKASLAQVESRQADAEFAQTTYQRWKDSPPGVVSEQEREAKKAGHSSAVAQLNVAQAQAALDLANVRRYVALRQFKQVTAPYSGTITERHIDIGNLVTAGSTSNTTSLYRMVQDAPIRVFVDVPQSAAGDIRTNLTAQVTASNIPGRVFTGKVARTADAINQLTRTLLVEVDIPNPDHALVSGMYVDVRFHVPTQGLVQVPAAALVFRSSGPQVVVVDKDNRVSFHKVTIARDAGKTVEIGSGLSAGDKVALNISSQIADGEKVEVHESTDGTNATNTRQ